MKLSELETRLDVVEKAATAMLDARDASGQEFTADQSIQFKALVAESKSLKNDLIPTERDAEELRKQKALNSVAKETPEAKVAKQYKYADAIGGLLRGRVDGVVAEMSQEAEREMKSVGISSGIQGVGLPSWMVNFQGKNVNGQDRMQKRDLTSGGAATGDELVEDNLLGHLYGLYIAPKVASLGAEVRTGLSGDVHFTKSGTATAVWETEVSAADETTPSTARVSMSPKRLAAFTDISKTLLTQTNGMAEDIVKYELSRAIATALDAAAINGSGSAPTGILGLSTDINSVAMGTDGGTPTRAKLFDMWTAIMADNADIGNLAWLTTPGIKAYLSGLVVDAGSGRFVWENDNVLGYNAAVSNNVPSTLTKGTSTSICHAIIFGVWNQLVIGQWGGIDLLVNPYTRAKENILEIVINANFDVKVKYEQAFCYMKDAKIS